MNFTTNHELVLASGSPRRKELFSMLKVPFQIVTSEVEEMIVQEDNMREYVRQVALLKARDVANKVPGKTVIGADTIVVFENSLFHKPKTREEAISHLQHLSDASHSVLTAVALLEITGAETTFVEETIVTFKKLPISLIEAYVDSGDPFDKAGGYGIQTLGTLFVDRIEGDYNNVVGLPLASLFEKLMERHILQIDKEVTAIDNRNSTKNDDS